MKAFLERISRVQYVVGFFILAFLRGIFLPVPEIIFFGGDGVATFSLFMGLTLLVFPFVFWAFEHWEIKLFTQRLLALALGLIGLFLHDSDPYVYFFALGLALLPRESKRTATMDWRFNGLFVFCAIGLLANVWLREKWLLTLIFSLVLVVSIFGDRLNRFLSKKEVPK